MDKKVVIHSKSRVFDGFFKIDEAYVSYERFDGQMSSKVRFLSFERGDSVAAIIFNKDAPKVILVEQFKYPTYAKGPGWIVETVAGILEEGETPEAAVRREILEEVGYEVEKLEHMYTFYVSPGGSSERIILYYAEVSDVGKVSAGGGVAGEHENIRTVELSIDELEASLAAGRIQDAKTIVGIMWLQRHLGKKSRRE